MDMSGFRDEPPRLSLGERLARWLALRPAPESEAARSRANTAPSQHGFTLPVNSLDAPGPVAVTREPVAPELIPPEPVMPAPVMLEPVMPEPVTLEHLADADDPTVVEHETGAVLREPAALEPDPSEPEPEPEPDAPEPQPSLSDPAPSVSGHEPSLHEPAASLPDHESSAIDPQAAEPPIAAAGEIPPEAPGPTPATEPVPTPTYPDVVAEGGVYHLRIAPGLTVPMLQHGAPLRELGNGWRYHSLYAALAPILLFELEHDNGDRATWYFDTAGSYLGNLLGVLPPASRAVLLWKAAALLADMLAPVVGRPTRDREADCHLFFGVSEFARREIAAACREALLVTAHPILYTDLPTPLVVRAQGALRPAAIISPDHLAAAMSADFQDCLLASARDGYLAWPSPVDGTGQRSSGALCFGHSAFAYRMEDPASGFVYFVLVSEQPAQFVGLYLPSEGLVLAKDRPGYACIQRQFPDLADMMVAYVCQYGATLVPALMRGGPKRIAGPLREQHFDRQIANELSGLEQLLRNVPAKRLPQLLSLDGAADAFFAPLEALFPEFRGRIRTELHTERDLIDYANRTDLLPAHFMRAGMTAELRDRILQHATTTEDGLAVDARRSQVEGPVILIGLRVENRTAVDLAGFITRLVRRIALAAPGALIVLDGQDAASMAPADAPHPAAAVEAEICHQVVAATHASGLQVDVSTGLASSIAWANRAACVIAFAGEGLLRYCWLANRPTLVLSNRHALLSQDTLLAYAVPAGVADPASMLFADPAGIYDEPDAPQLVPVPDIQFANFQVDEDVFFAQVDGFVAQFASVPAPA
jgi:hypothetical protein